MEHWSLLAWPRKVMQALGVRRGFEGTGMEPAAPAVHPQEIVLDVDADDAKSVLRMAAAYIARAHGLDAGPIARALERREEAGSTALGCGVAVPHARICGIAQPLTLFLRTRRPVAFGAPDGKDTTSFFVIMVPADGDADLHLQLLAQVASSLGDRDFRADLSLATTAQQVDDAFTRRGARSFTQSLYAARHS